MNNDEKLIMNNNEYSISKPCQDDQHRDDEADQTLPTDPQFLRQEMISTGCPKKVQGVPKKGASGFYELRSYLHVFWDRKTCNRHLCVYICLCNVHV